MAKARQIYGTGRRCLRERNRIPACLVEDRNDLQKPSRHQQRPALNNGSTDHQAKANHEEQHKYAKNGSLCVSVLFDRCIDDCFPTSWITSASVFFKEAHPQIDFCPQQIIISRLITHSSYRWRDSYVKDSHQPQPAVWRRRRPSAAPATPRPAPQPVAPTVHRTM